jgi:hypothetical protein
MDRCPLVLIEWLDSRQPSAGWNRLSSYEPAGACLCASVGWLIHDGKDMKALAPNMADIGDEEEDMQALGIIHIPAPAVKRIVALTEATSFPCADAISCCAPELAQKQPRSSRSSRTADRAAPLLPSRQRLQK